jgi:predicted RNase H-like nuclease (RuvC/YqgF family)
VRLFASLPQDQLARLVAALPPKALKDVVIDAIRDDEEFMAHLAALVAGRIAVPLDVATRRDLKRLERRMAKLEREVGDVKSRVEGLEKEVREIKNVMATKDDLKQFATKEDIEKLRADMKRIEDKMATKEQFEAIAVSVEDSGRDMVQYLLGQRGHRCVAERLRVDSEYEFDIYCNAGTLTAVGEAKVRAGGRDVERTFERVRELLHRWPDRVSGRLVPVLYALVAEPSAVQRAKELKVWFIESRRELVPLDEVS